MSQPRDRARLSCINVPAALLLGVLGVLCQSGRVSAEELGAKGNFTFAAERLFGFYIDKQSVSNNGVTVDTDATDFSLGWNHSPSGLTLPRLGVDYFITDHVTLGGTLGVYSVTTDRGAPGFSASGDETGVFFGARAGYALRISHAVSFWPRGGFTYFTINNHRPTADEHLLALTLEGMFTLAPSENWAILVGPAVDLGLTGRTNGNDLSEQSFGILAGLVGWFGT
jgi:hypothetical protein